MNEAFLDRFSYWFEQDYADRTVEARIIIRKMKAYGREDKEFAQYLVKWAETIRLGFKEGGLDEIITTRRLEEVCKAFAIFGDKQKAIKLTLTRFDQSTQDAFFALYTKIDPTIMPTPEGMPQPAKVAPTGDAKLAEEIEKALADLKPTDVNPTVISNTQYAVTA
jgi:hypothetical protein